MIDKTKSSRFFIYFSVFAAFSNAFLLFPFSIVGLMNGVTTNNSLQIAGSIFMIVFTVYGAIRHVLTLKKNGTKNWIDINTRLRKV